MKLSVNVDKCKVGSEKLKNTLCNSFVHALIVEMWDLCKVMMKGIIMIEANTWCVPLRPSIKLLHDEACFWKVCPMLPVGNWTILLEERPIALLCCVAMGCEHIQGHPIGPRHAQWCSCPGLMVAMANTWHFLTRTMPWQPYTSALDHYSAGIWLPTSQFALY